MAPSGSAPGGEFLGLYSYCDGDLTEVWSLQFADPGTDVYGLCCADLVSNGLDELYVGATDGLYVYEAGQIQYPSLTLTLTDGAAALRLWGAAGTTNSIEYATNLNASAQWLPLTTLKLPYTPYEFRDPDPATSGERFYRAVQLP